MLTQTNYNSQIKVLQVQSPSKLIEPNKNYLAKIVSNEITFKTVKSKKDGSPLQIAEVLVALDGYKPFKAAIISEDINTFCQKNVNDMVDIFIKFDGKYTNAEI